MGDAVANPANHNVRWIHLAIRGYSKAYPSPCLRVHLERNACAIEVPVQRVFTILVKL